MLLALIIFIYIFFRFFYRKKIFYITLRWKIRLNIIKDEYLFIMIRLYFKIRFFKKIKK